ncbi:exodeoxyribonuclease V subunit alpha [Mycolicibacterium duvalii]|uniref:RecBCD enzyme subunit RecD n=1 Tax=Mycolicibacterium duvalii TaxID=39688 RepID=A0A7I7K3G9_9MYCO|nr:exodeoxyribonuclease V subunit alpha [Mycolicibacterium duvalii]MCV7367785.1 exodeoxyribonuclease V subunit alpha [Mycolicibacterium duvalii]PEG42474.1 exodeoxyribonuclease V subunit alpha [Mycolicibacterium duvalii]BBX18625.1 RecBCD enzyme subunit RecD [Mycolicibacterium duvalii]
MTAAELLTPFIAAEVFEPADVHVATRLCALAGDDDQTVTLAAAFVVRALRSGSVCVDLRSVAEQVARPELPWPEPSAWLGAVRGSALAAEQVLRFVDDLLYFDRYWREEEQVCDDVLALVATPLTAGAPGLDRLFPAGWEEQRRAAEVALGQSLTVLTGGPGTGKTTTVARLLALLAEQAALAGRPPLRIALAAPTGKAAARLAEAVRYQIGGLDAEDRDRLGELTASTLHRLLQPRPGSSSRFRHHRENRLPHDVVVVDETSMVSLTLMARLLEAVRPDSRLLLVGDADQLASVEAGAVLADLVEGLGGRADVRVAALQTSHRFGANIGALAGAIRRGEAEQVLELLRTGGDHLEWLDGEEPTEQLRGPLLEQATLLRRAAILGDADAAVRALDGHRLLCAHRRGPYGVAHWNHQVQRWLADATGEPLWSQWYPGRPVLVTANDYGLRLFNGDTGVTVVRDEALEVVIGGTRLRPSRLAEIETMHAMTIHKSQGSQADDVTVLMPPPESRLLTRELFYTAVTRAKARVRVVGPESAIRAAIDRRALRASGLARRLRR